MDIQLFGTWFKSLLSYGSHVEIMMKLEDHTEQGVIDDCGFGSLSFSAEAIEEKNGLAYYLRYLLRVLQSVPFQGLTSAGEPFTSLHLANIDTLALNAVFLSSKSYS
jgi:hypothetical protein